MPNAELADVQEEGFDCRLESLSRWANVVSEVAWFSCVLLSVPVSGHLVFSGRPLVQRLNPYPNACGKLQMIWLLFEWNNKKQNRDYAIWS